MTVSPLQNPRRRLNCSCLGVFAGLNMILPKAASGDAGCRAGENDMVGGVEPFGAKCQPQPLANPGIDRCIDLCRGPIVEAGRIAINARAPSALTL